MLLLDAVLIERALSDADRDRARFVVVTFDPERDTPERMAAHGPEWGLEGERWSYLTADDRR